MTETNTSINGAAEIAGRIYQHVLSEVRADALLKKHVRIEDDTLHAGGHSFDLSKYDRIVLLGSGKASCPMAEAMLSILAKKNVSGLAITKRGHGRRIPGLRIMEASHPTPNSDSLEAGQAINEMAKECGENDLAICLLSGGASSLIELPAVGISLDALAALTSLLLRAGADIAELNTIRRRLSQLKAGGLARSIYPADGLCLVLSDVLGNDLSVIGSGPCYPGNSPMDPMQIFKKYGLWKNIPKEIAYILSQPAQSPQTDRFIPHVIIGDIHSALTAAEDSAGSIGSTSLLLSSALTGEAADAGKLLGKLALELPNIEKHMAVNTLLAGGETTVTVRGCGIGGRSQELALAAAIEMQGMESIALLAGSTDGTDGPTNAAGALVTGHTITGSNIVAAQKALEENNSYHFLKELGALLFTGPTESNVGDIVILVRADS